MKSKLYVRIIVVMGTLIALVISSVGIASAAPQGPAKIVEAVHPTGHWDCFWFPNGSGGQEWHCNWIEDAAQPAAEAAQPATEPTWVDQQVTKWNNGLTVANECLGIGAAVSTAGASCVGDGSGPYDALRIPTTTAQ